MFIEQGSEKTILGSSLGLRHHQTPRHGALQSQPPRLPMAARGGLFRKVHTSIVPLCSSQTSVSADGRKLPLGEPELNASHALASSSGMKPEHPISSSPTLSCPCPCVSSGCYSRIPYTVAYKQHTSISHGSEGREVQDQGAGRLRI